MTYFASPVVPLDALGCGLDWIGKNWAYHIKRWTAFKSLPRLLRRVYFCYRYLPNGSARASKKTTIWIILLCKMGKKSFTHTHGYHHEIRVSRLVHTVGYRVAPKIEPLSNYQKIVLHRINACQRDMIRFIRQIKVLFGCVRGLFVAKILVFSVTS